MYNFSYMGSLALSIFDIEQMVRAFGLSHKVFSSYKLDLQQDATIRVKIFLAWSKCNGNFGVDNLIIDIEANAKRKVFAHENSVFDPLRILFPTLIRSKLCFFPCTRFLGILVDCKLNFASKIRNVYTKVSSAIGICNKLVIILLFRIFPIFATYGIETWGHSSSAQLKTLSSKFDKSMKLLGNDRVITVNYKKT